MVRAIVVSLALSCLAAPAWTQPAPSPQTQRVAPAPAAKPPVKKPAPPKANSAAKPAAPAESGPCVGVISAIGDRFGLQKVGLTILGNEYNEATINAWGFDDLVVAKVRSAVNQRYAVRRIAHPADTFSPKKDREFVLFRNSEAELTALVKQVVASTKCARYVLVTKGSSKFNNLNQFVKGIGIVNYGFTPFERNYVFALSYVRVYDGQTFEVVKQGAAMIDEVSIMGSAIGLHIIRGPHKELDKSLWPGSPDEAAKSALMRDTARALLSASLDKSLPALLAQ
ncbi:MAG: hypothetical protein JWN71_3637 [Xanthobacteraceae bacterium]|nr:hypothetical protein [Xanthobacteraceae bacterium]